MLLDNSTKVDKRCVPERIDANVNKSKLLLSDHINNPTDLFRVASLHKLHDNVMTIRVNHQVTDVKDNTLEDHINGLLGTLRDLPL